MSGNMRFIFIKPKPLPVLDAKGRKARKKPGFTPVSNPMRSDKIIKTHDDPLSNVIHTTVPDRAEIDDMTLIENRYSLNSHHASTKSIRNNPLHGKHIRRVKKAIRHPKAEAMS